MVLRNRQFDSDMVQLVRVVWFNWWEWNCSIGVSGIVLLVGVVWFNWWQW